MDQVEGVIALAGQRDSNGDVYDEAKLKTLVDGRRLFWDEQRRALVYRGPAARGDLPQLLI